MIGPYPPKVSPGLEVFGWQERQVGHWNTSPTSNMEAFCFAPTPNCLLTVVDSKRRAVGIVRLRHPEKHPFRPTFLSTFLSQNKHMNTFPASATTTFIAAIECFFLQIIVCGPKKTKGMSLESVENWPKKVSKSQTSSPGFSWSGSASAERKTCLLPVRRWNDL